LSTLIGISSGIRLVISVPVFVKTAELGPIVGEKHDPRAIQHPKHACGDAVIALI
jgi:hypothetical protein